jgi:hypothetical protein
VAEADLGERIMRALILRRVGLIERGSGPVLVGRGTQPLLLALQAFLRRNGHPHKVIDIETDRLHLSARSQQCAAKRFPDGDLPGWQHPARAG